jgi:hypothetical protein
VRLWSFRLPGRLLHDQLRDPGPLLAPAPGLVGAEQVDQLPVADPDQPAARVLERPGPSREVLAHDRPDLHRLTQRIDNPGDDLQGAVVAGHVDHR